MSAKQNLSTIFKKWPGLVKICKSNGSNIFKGWTEKEKKYFEKLHRNQKKKDSPKKCDYFPLIFLM